jgi:hypothetical protein
MIDEFLRRASERRGISSTDLLREVLHVHSADWYEERFFPEASPTFMRLFMLVDQGIRERNPGLHYVDRSTYLGYRREQPQHDPNAETRGQRSQIFASVIKGVKSHPKLVLPVKPTSYIGLTGIRDLTGRGHHGVGAVEYDVFDESSIDRLFDVFGDWFSPKPFPRK